MNFLMVLIIALSSQLRWWGKQFNLKSLVSRMRLAFKYTFRMHPECSPFHFLPQLLLWPKALACPTWLMAADSQKASGLPKPTRQCVSAETKVRVGHSLAYNPPMAHEVCPSWKQTHSVHSRCSGSQTFLMLWPLVTSPSLFHVPWLLAAPTSRNLSALSPWPQILQIFPHLNTMVFPIYPISYYHLSNIPTSPNRLSCREFFVQSKLKQKVQSPIHSCHHMHTLSPISVPHSCGAWT